MARCLSNQDINAALSDDRPMAKGADVFAIRMTSADSSRWSVVRILSAGYAKLPRQERVRRNARNTHFHQRGLGSHSYVPIATLRHSVGSVLGVDWRP